MIRRLAYFFALSYAISWMVWLPLYGPKLGIVGLPIIPFHHELGAYGPLAAALMLKLSSGPGEGKALFKSMFLVERFPILLLALLMPFLLLLIAVLVDCLANGTIISLDGFGKSAAYPNWSMGIFFFFNLLTFGYGEEAGWRGFALPELQRRFSPLVSTLILTLFWALWHLPLFLYRSGYTSMGAAEIVGWFASLLTGSILLTWLFNSSRGSILVCAVFHAAVDVAFMSDLSAGNALSYLGAAITLWGIMTLTVCWRSFNRKPDGNII